MCTRQEKMQTSLTNTSYDSTQGLRKVKLTYHRLGVLTVADVGTAFK